MPTPYFKRGSGWEVIKTIYFKKATGWVEILSGYIRRSTGWVLFFAGVKIPGVLSYPKVQNASGFNIDNSTYISRIGNTLYGSRGTWSNTPTSYTDKWQWSSYQGGPYADFSPAQANTTLVTSGNMEWDGRYVVYAIKATNTKGASDWVYSSNEAHLVKYKPVNNTVTITGTTKSGQVLSASSDWQFTITNYGDISPEVPFFYSWTYSNGTAAYNDNNSTSYTLTDNDIGKTIRVNVTATNTGGSTTASSGYTATITSAAPVAPIPVSSPTLSGTGVAFTNVVSSPGTYQSGSFTSITNVVGWTTSSVAPTNGETSSSLSLWSNIYSITQSNATSPSFYYYSVDVVKNAAGTTDYFFYSPATKSSIGTVTDNYNRTTSSGIGVSSSGYTYSGPYNPSSGLAWRVDGSYVVTSSTPINYTASNWPSRTVELGGKVDINASVKLPSSIGGLGLTYWVTDSNNWWASTVNSYSTSVSNSTCTGTQITTDLYGSGCGGCSTSSTNTTTYNCTGTTKSTDVSGTGCSNGSYNCSVTTVAGSILCSTTVTNYATLVNTGTNVGDRCGTYTTSTDQQCNGTTSSYSNNTLSSACGGKCYCAGPYGNTYQCGTTYVTGRSSCGGTAGGVYNSSTLGVRCGSCFGVAPNYYYTVVTYTPTYYNCTVSTCGTSYNYTKRYQEASTYTCSPGTGTSTTYKCNPNVTTTTTTYKNEIKIWSAVSGTVSLQSSQDVQSSTTAYGTIWGLRVQTSGNTITSTAYTDQNLTTVAGSALIYTASNPTKALANGYSAAGIIKGLVTTSSGTSFDDLTIA